MRKIPLTFIYGLIDPRNQQLRYIGKVDNPKKRLHCHINGRFKTDSYKNHWLKNLCHDSKPELIILEKISILEWEDAEKWWIAYCKFLGVSLTNGTDGGDGVLPTPETRRKMSEAQTGEKHSMYGKRHTDETKRKMSNSHKGEKAYWYGKERIFSEEYKIKLSKSHQGKNNSMYGKHHSKEACQKIAFAASNRSQETRQKLSDSHKGKHHSSETKALMSIQRKGRKHSLKTRILMSESAKNRVLKKEVTNVISNRISTKDA